MTKYDVVWWWRGGEVSGEWCAACLDPKGGCEATVAEIRKGGRVAYPGLRSIGAPEGAPSREEIREVLP
jgi:hypothetical protein